MGPPGNRGQRFLAFFFDGDFLCIAHRGASGLAPENTLPAFQLALELGADAIELDVHLADDELVVIHDDDLSRTTNGKGRVSTSSLVDLRQLDAGDGLRIPLLSEVLDLVGDQMGINIELKGRGTAGPVVDLLRARGQGPNHILLSAFDHDELVAARSAAPEYPRGVTEADLPVLVYTVNDPERALALRAMGCVGVFTDHPETLLQALQRRP